MRREISESGLYVPVLNCGHEHVCAMRCDECREQSCPECTYMSEGNIMTCKACAPAVLAILRREAELIGFLVIKTDLERTIDGLRNDIRQIEDHAHGLEKWMVSL